MNLLAILASFALQFLFVVILVAIARSRRHKCSWTIVTANSKLQFGIAIVVAVQVGGFINLYVNGYGTGILGILQWVGVYWIAMSIYRKRDLAGQFQVRDLPFS